MVAILVPQFKEDSFLFGHLELGRKVWYKHRAISRKGSSWLEKDTSAHKLTSVDSYRVGVISNKRCSRASRDNSKIWIIVLSECINHNLDFQWKRKEIVLVIADNEKAVWLCNVPVKNRAFCRRKKNCSFSDLSMGINKPMVFLWINIWNVPMSPH